ncbi:MAG: YihY/virulence factor BrkB family protein [Armatimonadota bacterium]|nr:YihY/virulence factor BrkB family protein [Armatimonadota bacterium]
MFTHTRYWFHIAQRAYRSWREHDVPLLSAAIAFYAMLSLSPLLVVAVAVTALVVEPDVASQYLINLVAQAVNDETARFVQDVLRNTQRASNTFSAAGISLLLMLLGAARLFRQLKAAVNIIWGTRAALQGMRATVRDHLLAVLMVLLVATALLVWLGVDIVLAALSARWKPVSAVWRWLNFGAGWALATLLFASAYHLLPDERIRWRDVWAGAAIGAFLFALCKLLVGVYLGLTGVQSAYGAASAAVVLLLWAYFSTQAFLFGAEWARVVWEINRGGEPATTPPVSSPHTR